MSFDESAWLRLLFLVSDTRAWIDEMERDTLSILPVSGKKKIFGSGRLSAIALAHILERHYFRIPRHPGTSKFTMPVIDIVHWVEEACRVEPQPIPGSVNLLRVLDTKFSIGHDMYGAESSIISVITDQHGAVKTAFPGKPRTAAR